MKKESTPLHTHTITAGDLTYTFLKTGDLFSINSTKIMINQWQANVIDGSLNNIYLRIHSEKGIQSCPLLGCDSPGKVQFSADSIQWRGTFYGVSYEVHFLPDENNVWFWNVHLSGNGETADIVCGQDLGLGEPGMVRNNEAYASQYIDHTPFHTEEIGYTIGSRQNQPQAGGNPYLQQGSFQQTDGYTTDGFQFFGLSYKDTNEPELLNKAGFPNVNYQYEFAYVALKTSAFTLDTDQDVTFYALFNGDHPDPVTAPESISAVQEAWTRVRDKRDLSAAASGTGPFLSTTGGQLQTLPFSADELANLFPERKFEELAGDTLLSFFTPAHEHVVLPAKELQVERPHGHILMTGNNESIKKEVITTTSYLAGIFNSQVAIGNTSFHKLMTNTRNALNIPKTSGQRLYVEIDGAYQLLAMPSLFEMGFNYARWYYKTDRDVIVISNYTTTEEPSLHLEVESTSGTAYRFLLSNQISMANHEYDVAFHVSEKNGAFYFQADAAAESSRVYPDLTYKMSFNQPAVLKEENMLRKGIDSETASLVLFEFAAASSLKVKTAGSLDGTFSEHGDASFHSEKEQYRSFLQSLMNGFHMEMTGSAHRDVAKLNTLAWWYTHNMLVHYSVPHGLEQHGAAAWGTRDVCQGPAEYFLAMQKYPQVKKILQIVYSHQYEDTGNWPQWFMFDHYQHIQQEESHGDIIVWPLKLLADYLESSGDEAILYEQLPYTDRTSKQFTAHTPQLLDHVNKQLDYIKAHFLHDTFLSSYGDGDWDDTLQPANQELKQYMVSSWTVALTYQTLTKLTTRLPEEIAQDVQHLADGIRRDYETYLRDHAVIPGFLYLQDQHQPKKMVHPNDTNTGIHYRLLPMIRSMISELFDPNEAADHYSLIQQHLLFPDGARLMNKPAQYSGGVSKHFKRAEQSANFGREIGLQYVHAHIRFIEAMAKTGRAQEAWHGLTVINPVCIREAVPNAMLRQSNTYFSSSDGNFYDRYQAAEQFDELKDGNVKVKGGWRIYSSGPGIYMNQLISNVLGIQKAGADVILDPVLSDELNGLKVTFAIEDCPVTIRYHIGEREARRVDLNGETVATKQRANRYRSAGFHFEQKLLAEEEMNEIDIYL
ncbi:GH36-type glycosyl hydrolase domain-containing protein [Salisediminibacterium halotolerans]|uniref:GH36-type glycosyl hydrolase domain-containing protein n=1 Tax=Salisediminibacterium halotolerans TaxID=517425 RepID=UPI000F1C04F8|nr:cellobiose phosphorylase [Salisediminibacterium halotolerans]RLJ72307.1 cellobiose phosphorylase [Actinophytocola xinjiangensis]RPE85521.1 cellobiose phosphorylase [Salisediminibacterium halotolerans]TWG33476.1 cellobiose phosphorylase [Salisediminibacterium halotolerans]GEL07927.1 hypothetical protein SHA02_13430 [Salisediminibacterium halotolerans]